MLAGRRVTLRSAARWNSGGSMTQMRIAMAAAAMMTASTACVVTPQTPPRPPPHLLSTTEACSRLTQFGDRSLDSECFRRAREGDCEAMSAMLGSTERFTYQLSLDTLGHYFEVKELLRRCKAGSEQRQAASDSFWTYWACTGHTYPDIPRSDCIDRAHAGHLIAVFTFLHPSNGENRVLRSLAESDMKTRPSSRERLGKAFAVYWKCRSSAPEQECLQLAQAGEPVAVEGMRVRARASSRDIEAFRWTAALVRTGDIRDIDAVLETFDAGGVVPRNEPRLREAIEIGASQGHMPSILAKAAYVQDVDPSSSRELYLKAAKGDNCFAQALLGASYLNGIFTEVNEAKAYFWWALSMRQRERAYTGRMPPYLGDRLAEAYGRQLTSLDAKYAFTCGGGAFRVPAFVELESKAFAQEVKELLSLWTPGVGAPEQLERYTDRTLEPVPMIARTALSLTPRAASQWRPYSLARSFTFAEEVRAEAVYERVAKSVYVVIAGPSRRALVTRDGVAQGSAVALDNATLVTNCHIIEGRPDIRVVADGRLFAARVVAADVDADTCILGTSGVQLSPVIGIRRSNAVRVGEEVYAIGSPRGFTNSMSKGIVSQIRAAASRRLLQTTAQISGGSSGGGLFDRYGNLVGITTFKIRDAEGLNFAIAIEEFLDSH